LKPTNFKEFSLTKIPFLWVKKTTSRLVGKGGRIHFLASIIQSPAPFFEGDLM